jgi:hypothetical protein
VSVIGVGIETGPDGASEVGGRTGFFIPGGPCLRCAGEIDEEEAAEDLSPHALHQLRIARGYAADRRVEPALMPLNTTVAGLAMLELLAFATGMRAVESFQRFDALRGRIIPLRVDRRSGLHAMRSCERHGRSAKRCAVRELRVLEAVALRRL